MIDDLSVLKTMQEGQAQHYKDDEKSFGAINTTLETQNKTFARHEELLLINSEHNSHIRKDLNETMNTIKEINKIMVRIMPIVVSYEENLTFVSGLKKRGGWVLAGAGALITISAGWYIIKAWLISLK